MKTRGNTDALFAGEVSAGVPDGAERFTKPT